MNIYSIYITATGLFTGNTIQCAQEHLNVNIPDGCSCVLGAYDALSQKVNPETGAVMDYQPPQPSSDYAWDDQAKRWVYVPTLDDVKSKRCAEINQQCTMLLAAIVSSYPPDEVQSWPQQLAEAQAYRAGGTSTPLLTALSTARGITVDDLVSRVLAKADQFAIASGKIIGSRQRCADQIDSAQSSNDVEAVTWPDD